MIVTKITLKNKHSNLLNDYKMQHKLSFFQEQLSFDATLKIKHINDIIDMNKTYIYNELST
jgi:hypothetical protein